MNSGYLAILLYGLALVATLAIRPADAAQGTTAATQSQIQDLNNQEAALKDMHDTLEQITRETQHYTEALDVYIATVVLQGEMRRKTGVAKAAEAADQNNEVQREIKERLTVITQQISTVQTRIATLGQDLERQRTEGQRDLIDARVPPTACAAAGNWSNELPGVGFSKWTITDAGDAREKGLAGATGHASLEGTILTIEWTRSGGFAGTYVIELNAACDTGKGTMHLTLMPPGATPLMTKSFFTRQ
jgi:hypothetical protein